MFKPSLIAALAVPFLLAAHGCNKDPQPTAAPTEAPAATTPSVASTDTDGDTCRDWSELDPATLPALPSSEYTETFDHAWETILTRHYDPTIGCTDWPALRAEYGEKVAAAKDQAAAYALMNEMLGKLRQSHMVIVPPGVESKGEPRSGKASHAGVVPIRTRVIKDEVVITDVKAHGFKTGVPVGSILTAVGEHDVGALVEKMGAKYDRDVESSIHVARTVAAWLSCPVGESRTLQYRAVGADKSGPSKTKKVGCKAPKVERVSMGNIQNFPTEFEARLIKGTKTGYIRFSIWMMPLLEKIEAGVAKLEKQGMQHLVLDLRGNPGGVGMMAVPVARMLLDKEVSLGVMTMRGTTQHFNVKPQGGAFAGSMAILVDEGTGSTSEIFAQAMQDLGRVKIVGATTSQGAVLASFIEKLPGGATLQFVVADYKSPNGEAVEGKGVVPDVLVDATAGDYAKGRDPVLDAAVAAVSAAKTANPQG